MPFDRLCVWERYTESPKTCAASSPTHDSACSRRVLGLRFFGNSHRVEALPDGGRASSGLHRPQEPISFPPIADEKSYICSLTVVNDIKRLALRESSRRSRVRGLSTDHVRPVLRETRCIFGVVPLSVFMISRTEKNRKSPLPGNFEKNFGEIFRSVFTSAQPPRVLFGARGQRRAARGG